MTVDRRPPVINLTDSGLHWIVAVLSNAGGILAALGALCAFVTTSAWLLFPHSTPAQHYTLFFSGVTFLAVLAQVAPVALSRSTRILTTRDLMIVLLSPRSVRGFAISAPVSFLAVGGTWWIVSPTLVRRPSLQELPGSTVASLIVVTALVSAFCGLEYCVCRSLVITARRVSQMRRNGSWHLWSNADFIAAALEGGTGFGSWPDPFEKRMTRQKLQVLGDTAESRGQLFEVGMQAALLISGSALGVLFSGVFVQGEISVFGFVFSVTAVAVAITVVTLTFASSKVWATRAKAYSQADGRRTVEQARHQAFLRGQRATQGRILRKRR